MYNKAHRVARWFPSVALCLGLMLLNAWPILSKNSEGWNAREGREEELRSLREKRDRFFKQDPHSPLRESDRKGFKGLFYYPIDLTYAMVGPIERYPLEPPFYASLPTSKGTEKKYIKFGRFKFRWLGKNYLLQIYRPLGEKELFLPFRDRTSEAETYPRGRYLFIEPMPEGRVLIDFNRAYNPFCEYNDRYTCTFAPQENWLRIEVRAGEKRFR